RVWISQNGPFCRHGLWFYHDLWCIPLESPIPSDLEFRLPADRLLFQGHRSLNSNYSGAYFAPSNFGENSMASSVWSGYLTFGLISMPVRLFSGARSSGISFNMLHRDDLSRVKQQYVCPAEDNKVVDRSE